MLFIVAILLLAATIVGFLFFGMQAGILLAFFSKPIIDGAWASNILPGINTARLLAVFFPAFLLFKLLSSRVRISKFPLFGIWTAYTFYFVVISAVMATDKGIMDAVNLIFRHLNGYVAYFALPICFSDRKSFKRLLIVFIIAGIFPASVAIFQAATGIIIEERITIGLVRNVGFYHDTAALRHHLMPTFAGLILYWSYFGNMKSKMWKKLLLLGFGCICLLALFKGYTKGGYLIALAWIVIWTVARRDIRLLAFLGTGILVVSAFFYEQLWSDVETLFSKEVAALTVDDGSRGAESIKQKSLAGRWGGWEAMLKRYADRPVLMQIFGGGKALAAHNDYLGALLQGGLVGLILYVALLTSIGKRIWKLYRRKRSPINIMAVMLFAMWLIDSIGLGPRMYISYQWFVWGLIGLAFRGIDSEIPAPSKSVHNSRVGSGLPSWSPSSGGRSTTVTRS